MPGLAPDPSSCRCHRKSGNNRAQEPPLASDNVTVIRAAGPGPASEKLCSLRHIHLSQLRPLERNEGAGWLLPRGSAQMPAQP